MPLKLGQISLNLPFGLGGVQIEVTETQARAAWELYVELATRISAAPLERDAGSIREALDSLYTLFGTTRQVLRAAGPDVATGPDSLGPVAIRILNDGLRPFVSKWHTQYRRAEAAAGDGWDERTWADAEVFRDQLEATRLSLVDYVYVLAEIAGVTR